MSANTLRMLGLLCLVASVVLAILNLKQVVNLGTFWLSGPLLVIGAGLVVLAKRRG